MFNIEKNVNIPKSAHNKYPFGDMEIGDSFLVPKGIADRPVLSSAASQYGRRHGKLFSTRVTEEGIRVWRVE